MKICLFNLKEGRLGGGVKVKKGEKDRDYRFIVGYEGLVGVLNSSFLYEI